MSDRDSVDWDAFEASLAWAPIAAYDRVAGAVALLRAGEDERMGVRGLVFPTRTAAG